jgi:deazaflavin-dependent oxidoreductase (nitroreductase family)
MAEMPKDLQEANRRTIEEFRAAGRKLDGRALLLLTTTGAKTGRPRTNPMMYVEIDGRRLVIASNAGAPKHPDWYRNLVANPSVTVECDGEEYAATASPTTGADRDELFAEIVRRFPFFGDHQAGVERTIPVVELVRSSA